MILLVKGISTGIPVPPDAPLCPDWALSPASNVQ